MKQNPEEKKELLVDCIAEQARPKPRFEWWLGGEKLNVSVKSPNKLTIKFEKA